MIILCIGQAGCQIGEQIIECDASFNPSGGYYPAVFADVDKKVIHGLLKSKVISKCVKKVNVIHGQSDVHGEKRDKFIQNILDHLRDEIVQQNNECCIAFVHSLIGFTSYSLIKILAEEIKERFNKVKIVSFTILPFDDGESSFQHYNSFLSLDVLKRYFSLCFLIGNDHLLDSVSKIKLLQKSFSFSEMNNAIANQTHMILRKLDQPSDGRMYRQTAIDCSEIYIPNGRITVLDELIDLSLINCFYFMGIGMMMDQSNINKMCYKNALTKLSRKCVSYLKFIKPKEKLTLERALLFCDADVQEYDMLNSCLTDTFSARFQVQDTSGELFKVYNGTRGVRLITRENPLCAVCFQSQHLNQYVNKITQKVESMLKNDSFVQYYSPKGRKEEEKVTSGKKKLEKEFASFMNHFSMFLS